MTPLPNNLINIAAFRKATRMVGPGLRDAFFVQGCTIGCPGCANQAYLPVKKSRVVPVKRFLDHFRLRVGKIDGVSLLGGEPTEQHEAVAEILEGAQGMGLSTVVFTGHRYRYLASDQRYRKLLAHTDLLIDGPFIAELYHPDLFWRGSANQNFICLTNRFKEEDLKPGLANGELVVGPENLVFHGVGTQQLLV
ncbi:MAG: 4Fe-4S single cluster domain-containing protein [Acidobacteriota bacterium]|nr:4Fe-4S single cluster domain-containing protein [Acidobacteriota bacterium]